MRTKQQELIAIGKRIRQVREKQQFSQEDFAEYVGISRSHYGCIERGRFAVSLPKLLDIAMALDIEVGELFPPLTELKETKALNGQ